MASNKSTTDGERKAVIVPAGPGMVRFVGLLPRSKWSKVRKNVLFTQRVLLGATLHDQSLEGQLPPLGYEFPAGLLEGRGKGKTGKAMNAKLATSDARAQADRTELKELRSLKSEIL